MRRFLNGRNQLSSHGRRSAILRCAGLVWSRPKPHEPIGPARHGTVLYPAQTLANLCEPVANMSRTFVNPSRMRANSARNFRESVANLREPVATLRELARTHRESIASLRIWRECASVRCHVTRFAKLAINRFQQVGRCGSHRKGGGMSQTHITPLGVIRTM
eukprot:360795-Prymnesium_polylepis.1